jgi:hypothetical protein
MSLHLETKADFFVATSILLVKIFGLKLLKTYRYSYGPAFQNATSQTTVCRWIRGLGTWRSLSLMPVVKQR